MYRIIKVHRPVLIDELLCRIQLLAELLHLLVVAETLFVVLVELQTLPDVAVSKTRRQTGSQGTWRPNKLAEE